ncbi:conjugal transfer protein [Photobacterium iliopiscarium]|uniref:TIGR03756 family integrating conjugative element protein n=2 Tax=Photobacterium iliopiscarium TaxID=56192 RepID=A0ABX5GMH6_9GAMM|nr:conjugal transfer protein [Photobacterium iliopiscarium]PSW92288.1 TIGR03756 family integrating conjugative element protein [Photobacterium iliopiscarium]
MVMKRSVLALSLVCALSSASSVAAITTPEIIQSSLCFDCIDYNIIGACLWMTCTPIGCSTATSIKVKHRLPDMVAMSYPETGHGPWAATAWMSPKNPLAQGGGNSHGRSPQLLDHASVSFQNVDIIGHPAEGSFFKLLSTFGYVLEGPAKPFMPYFLSSLDVVGWRFNIPDIFNSASWNPLKNKVGTFGNIYPRGGFSVQPHPYKSAALAAFKAAHITTRENMSRVYQPLVAKSKPGYWPPSPVDIDNKETAWQPLYPKKVMKAAVWPDIDDRLQMGDPYANRISDNGQYVWAVWRTYRGCERKGQTLIAHFGQ